MGSEIEDQTGTCPSIRRYDDSDSTIKIGKTELIRPSLNHKGVDDVVSSVLLQSKSKKEQVYEPLLPMKIYE